MKSTAAILFCLLVGMLAGQSQTLPPNGNSAISRTGQFVINGVNPQGFRPRPPNLETNHPLVQLEPALLTVSCERIKRALLSTLNAPDQWRGKIFIVLHPLQNAAEDITITSEHFSDGWRYRVDLPDAVEPPRLVRAVTQLLLLEMANRNASEQSAQLPAWLAEGMPQLLLAGSDIDLVLQPAQPASGNNLANRAEMREARPTDLFKQSRERLRQTPPLTIAQLGRAPDDLASDDGKTFLASAVLFLHELLQLPGGGQALFAALPELTWDPDWRVAVIHGFHAQFKREVDLEKWWALQMVYVNGRTPEKTWSRAEGLEKLHELLLCPLEVQLSTNEPAFQTTVSLQAVIKGWEFPRQNQVLQEKIRLLDALRLRLPMELTGLAGDYRRTLEVYLRNLGGGKNDKTPPPRSPGRHLVNVPMFPTDVPASNKAVVRDVLLQLDVLDQRRDAWQAAPETAP
jgi:hypothetical protein